MSATRGGKGTRARRLADYVLRELDPLVAKQGFGEASLLMQWREIVGVRVAALCQPERLKWPPRPRGLRDDARQNPRDAATAKRDRPGPRASGSHLSCEPEARGPEARGQEPATLILRVEPGFGLDIQHMAPAIIDRVNAHLGWRCVAKVALRQEPLASLAPKAAGQRPAPPIDPAARAKAESATEGVREPGLRAALARLGEHAFATKQDAT